MRLSPPRQVTFWLSIIIAALGILAAVLPIAGLADFAFWLVVIAFVILVIGNVADGI